VHHRGFYKYAVEEELLDNSPAAHVRRPRLDYESHAVAPDRNELGALLVAAGLGPPLEHALISLLALNGRRGPPGRSTWPSGNGRKGGYSWPGTAGGWTGTALGGSSARQLPVRGSPSWSPAAAWTGMPLKSSPPTSQAPPDSREAGQLCCLAATAAGIMLPGPATAGPGRRMEPDGGPCGDSRTSPRPLSRIWGTVGALGKAGAMVAHQGHGRRVRDKPAVLDLRGH